jgi:Domain of unknown function (DUF4190)
MSEGSGGEPEREQDPWSQPTDSAPPGPAAAQPEPGGYASPGPESWSTTWADPGSPTRPSPPEQPGSSDGSAPQQYGHSPAPRQDPQAAGQYGYQPAPGQYVQTPGQYPQAGQYGYQPAPDQDPQAAGQYPQASGQYGYPPGPGQYGYPPGPGQYPQQAGQYGPQQWPAYPGTPRNNRVAIAALVCGVAQFVLGLLVVGNILLAIPAIICGAIGLRQTRERGEPGRGMAIAGLVLGILGVVYFVIIVVVLIILGSIHHSGSA